MPAVAITAVVYLIFKGKKEREIREKLQYRLKEAVKIQNQIIEQLNAYIHKLKKKLVNEIEKNNQLSRKVDELYAINQSLIDEINKMTSQLG